MMYHTEVYSYPIKTQPDVTKLWANWIRLKEWFVRTWIYTYAYGRKRRWESLNQEKTILDCSFNWRAMCKTQHMLRLSNIDYNITKLHAATRHPGFFLKFKGQSSFTVEIVWTRTYNSPERRTSTAAISGLQPSCNVNMSNVSHDVMMQQLGNKVLAETWDQTNKLLSPSRLDKLYTTHADTKTDTFWHCTRCGAWYVRNTGI